MLPLLRTIPALAFSAALTFALGGCGGDDAAEPTAEPASATPATGGATGEAPAITTNVQEKPATSRRPIRGHQDLKEFHGEMAARLDDVEFKLGLYNSYSKRSEEVGRMCGEIRSRLGDARALLQISRTASVTDARAVTGDLAAMTEYLEQMVAGTKSVVDGLRNRPTSASSEKKRKAIEAGATSG